MNIIQINPYYPPYLGGAEQRIRDLSEKLSKKGHQVEVFTSNIGCPKDKQLKSTKNLKIHYLPAKEFAHTPIIPSLYKELMKIPQESVMHVHVGRAISPEISLLISNKKKIPYIAHIRTNSEPISLIGKIILKPYKRLFLKRVLKDAKKIITLNKDYKNLFAKTYDLDKKKFVVIPNSTDFKIIDKNKILIRKDIREILFVGRLTPEKNIDLIIKSIFLLENREIILNLVGDGEYKDKLINLVNKFNLTNQINFIGILNRKDLYKQYLKSDLVILPSKVECFSSVLLEAMATGVPIIASDIPGTRSVIKNRYNGLLVEPTPEKIAQAIDKLIKNPKLRERLAKNGLKEVKKYSWDKIVEQTEKVYEEVLKEHNKKLKQKK